MFHSVVVQDGSERQCGCQFFYAVPGVVWPHLENCARAPTLQYCIPSVIALP